MRFWALERELRRLARSRRLTVALATELCSGRSARRRRLDAWLDQLRQGAAERQPPSCGWLLHLGPFYQLLAPPNGVPAFSGGEHHRGNGQTDGSGPGCAGA